MYYRQLFVVIVLMVERFSGRFVIRAFHFHDIAVSLTTKRLYQQLHTSRKTILLDSTNYSTIKQTQQRCKAPFVLNRPQQLQYHPKKPLRAIHEPQSDITPSSPFSSWSPSLLFHSTWIKDRHQLASIIRATIVVGLSSYYFYKGLYSISSAISFWEAEGDLILKPLSVATWSAELIGLITLSKSMVYLLVGLTQLSPLQSAALSGIPCLLYLLRGIVSQSLMRVGFNPFFGPLVISYATLVNLLTFTNIIPPEKLKKYLYMPLVAAGIFAWSLPTTSATLFGVELRTAMDKVLWIFVGRSLISTGTLIYSLALGGNAKPRLVGLSRAMRNMTAWTAITTIIDVVFTRQNDLLAAGFSLNKAYRFILVSVTASGLLFALPEP